QVVLHARLVLAEPDENDLGFLVRHRVDGDVQAGAGWTHLVALLEPGARTVGRHGEPPGRGRVGGVADGPGEAVRRVARGHRADRLPLPHGRVGVAAGEPAADRR